MASDPLESLRCPKGCSTRFINYLTYEDTDLRVAESRTAWGGTVWDLGFRCGDCGLRYGRMDVPQKVKDKLDELLEEVASALEDLLGAEDDRLLREAIDSLPRMIEENR